MEFLNFFLILCQLGLVDLAYQGLQLLVIGTDFLLDVLDFGLIAPFLILQLRGLIAARRGVVQGEILGLGIFQLFTLVAVLFPVERAFCKVRTITALGGEGHGTATFHLFLVRHRVILLFIET